MYDQLQHTKTLHYAHRVYLFVSYCFHKKERFYPYTALTCWFLYRRYDVYPVRYEISFRYVAHRKTPPLKTELIINFLLLPNFLIFILLSISEAKDHYILCGRSLIAVEEHNSLN
jgi:hypothetical protein